MNIAEIRSGPKSASRTIHRDRFPVRSTTLGLGAIAVVYGWILQGLSAVAHSADDGVLISVRAVIGIAFLLYLLGYYRWIFNIEDSRLEGADAREGIALLVVMSLALAVYAAPVVFPVGRWPLHTGVVTFACAGIVIGITRIRFGSLISRLVIRMRRFRRVFMLHVPRKRELLAAKSAMILAGVSVLVWLLMVVSGVDPISPTEDDLLSWGGVYPPEKFGTEWWRMLVSMFIHSGVDQLTLNVIVLILVGSILEPVIGWLRMVMVYLATGFLASWMMFLTAEDLVWCGSSAAIFGLTGASLVFSLNRGIRRGVVRAEFITGIFTIGIMPELFGLAVVPHFAAVLPGMIFGGYLLEGHERSRGKDPTLP